MRRATTASSSTRTRSPACSSRWPGASCAGIPRSWTELPTDTGFSAPEFVRLVEEERATDGMLVGDTLGIPIAYALAARSHDTSSLRFLTAGSALLSVATKRRLLEEVPH